MTDRWGGSMTLPCPHVLPTRRLSDTSSKDVAVVVEKAIVVLTSCILFFKLGNTMSPCLLAFKLTRCLQPFAVRAVMFPQILGAALLQIELLPPSLLTTFRSGLTTKSCSVSCPKLILSYIAKSNLKSTAY
jgi:hypothetical protein